MACSVFAFFISDLRMSLISMYSTNIEHIYCGYLVIYWFTCCNVPTGVDQLCVKFLNNERKDCHNVFVNICVSLNYISLNRELQLLLMNQILKTGSCINCSKYMCRFQGLVAIILAFFIGVRNILYWWSKFSNVTVFYFYLIILIFYPVFRIGTRRPWVPCRIIIIIPVDDHVIWHTKWH